MINARYDIRHDMGTSGHTDDSAALRQSQVSIRDDGRSSLRVNLLKCLRGHPVLNALIFLDLVRHLELLLYAANERPISADAPASR